MARTIIYFLPLFYLVSILIFSGVSKITKSKILVGLILIILVLNIYVNYPGGFFYEGPILPKEVTLVDYEKAFNYVQEFTNKSIIVSDSAGYSGLFHTNNEIYLLGEFKNRNFEMLLERDKIFLENTTNMYLFSLNIPIITDPKKEREFIENKCVVVRQGYFLLNPSTIKEIEQTHNNKIFKNIIVYIPRNISKVNG